MADGFYIPDGNEALRDDIPAVVKLIERNARWVHPETFRTLPVWAPHTARGRPLYDRKWTRRYTNTRKATGVTAEKFEGNVAALSALVAALGVASPKPKNWTVCHIWGYDDVSFAQRSNVVQDPRYFSCVANMVWLPTSLKGFTDTLPEIKAMLRVCSFHLYGWACEHPSVVDLAAKVRSGWNSRWVSEDLAEPRSPGCTAAGDRPFHRAHREGDRQAKAENQSGCHERDVSALPEGGGIGSAEVLERKPGPASIVQMGPGHARCARGRTPRRP